MEHIVEDMALTIESVRDTRQRMIDNIKRYKQSPSLSRLSSPFLSPLSLLSLSPLVLITLLGFNLSFNQPTPFVSYHHIRKVKSHTLPHKEGVLFNMRHPCGRYQRTGTLARDEMVPKQLSRFRHGTGHCQQHTPISPRFPSFLAFFCPHSCCCFTSSPVQVLHSI